MTHKHTLKLTQVESSCLTHWHTNTHILQRIARVQALAAVWWVYYVCNFCHGPLSLAPHVFLSAGFKHAWCLKRRWKQWQYLFLKYINQDMFIMTLCAPPPALCAVRISVYKSGWLTWILMLCAEWQPAIKPDLGGTYRLSQPPRGTLLPLGSTFTFCLVFASWMWRPTQMQRRISTSDRADTFGLSGKE